MPAYITPDDDRLRLQSLNISKFSDRRGALVGFIAIRGGRHIWLDYRTPTIDVYDSNGTWAKRPGVVRVIVYGLHAGGGGGGPGAPGPTGGSGGGGGGSFRREYAGADFAALPATVPVIIGRGSRGVMTGTAVAGGLTSFNRQYTGSAGGGGKSDGATGPGLGGNAGSGGYRGGTGAVAKNSGSPMYGGGGGGAAGREGHGRDSFSWQGGSAGSESLGGRGGSGGLSNRSFGSRGNRGAGGGGSGWNLGGSASGQRGGDGGNGRMIVESWYY